NYKLFLRLINQQCQNNNTLLFWLRNILMYQFRIFVVLSMIFFVMQSYAIMVNGCELSTILSPDQSLFYRLPDDATHDYGISLSIKDGDILIGAVKFGDV